MRATGMHEYPSEHHAANMKGEEIVLNKAYNIMSDYTPGKLNFPPIFSKYQLI